MDPKLEKQKGIFSWKLISLIAAGLLFAGLIMFLRYGQGGTEILWNISDGGKWLLPLVLVSALLDSINPCAFSILLLTIAFEQ